MIDIKMYGFDNGPGSRVSSLARGAIITALKEAFGEKLPLVTITVVASTVIFPDGSKMGSRLEVQSNVMNEETMTARALMEKGFDVWFSRAGFLRGKKQEPAEVVEVASG